MERKIHQDYILIPLGLLLMVAYHLWLLYRVIRHPATTVIGGNAIIGRFWVRNMMLDPAKNGVVAVQTLRNNIMASTLLATTAITLCSVIAILMNHSLTETVLGPRDWSVLKFFTILVCFLLAFLLNLQSIRYYSDASIFINAPLKGRRAEMAAMYAMNHGWYFWSLGLRAFYFSLPLFFWVFGPVPMVVCCLVLVVMLYFLDVNSVRGEEMDVEHVELGTPEPRMREQV